MTLGPADFAGLWQLRRQIMDHRAGQQGALQGQVQFGAEAKASILRYDEVGQLQIADSPKLEARRTYFWHFEAAQVRVTFADGGAFHSFAPRGQAAGTDHPCGDDYYQVQYDFTHWPRWQSVWNVRGPRKDYRMVSDYQR